MTDFLSQIPDWISVIIVGVPLIVGGGMAIIGITDKKAKERTQERQAEADKLQENIRKLYLEESEAQNEKIKEQGVTIVKITERLTTVEAENGIMKGLLQGTDPKSSEYRSRVESTLALVDKLAEVILQNGKKSDKILTECLGINKNIERLTSVIAKK